MTISDRTKKTTADGVLAAVRRLAPAIGERSREIEAARRMPADLLDELIAAGGFRIVVPASHGGAGGDLPSALRVFEELARADASAGWTVMIGAMAWTDLAALPRDSFDALFATPDSFIVAGAFNPTGSIAAAGGGYRVDGRWSFASGCEHARWLWGNCVEGFPGGVPQLRVAVFAPDQAVIEDTWNVSGLRGTGSHHFHVRATVVPAERTLRPLVDEPALDEPIVRIPPTVSLPLAIAAVALGAATGALDDIVALAAEKVPLLADAALAQNPHFGYELATADTELRAARALLYEHAARAWAAARDGAAPSLPERARIRAAGVWITERAAAVVASAYRAGGGTSLYDDCPLQRRLRDVAAVTQHFLVRRDTLTTAGAILAGREDSPAIF